MPAVDLSLGTLEYRDHGTGPAVMLLHGLLQTASTWDEVIADLGTDHRVIAPTLPLGGHTAPMRAEADLDPRTTALLVGELANALELPEDTVFVENDSGHLQTLAAARPERVRRMVIVGCEAFDNYPPGSPGKLMYRLAKIPGGMKFLALAMGPRPLRRVPGTGFAVMSEKPIPYELTDEWLAPLRADRRIRADLTRYLQGTRKDAMLHNAEALAEYDGSALVVWGRQDRVMPPAHGRRMADLLHAELVELDDCGTLIPIDRPKALAASIRKFTANDRE